MYLVRMSKQKGATPLQKWIDSRKESAQKTAEYLRNYGIKVHRETVRRWQAQDRKPTRELLTPLATATGLAVSDLLK